MRTILCLCLLSLTGFGCDDGDDPMDGDAGMTGETPIFGTWVDPFATEHVISENEWTQTFDGKTTVYTIVTIDADMMTVIAENGADNEFNPGLFSRFDWTQVDDRLFFCQSAFDKESAEDAAAAAAADDTDPTTSGCGGMFPWSELLTP